MENKITCVPYYLIYTDEIVPGLNVCGYQCFFNKINKFQLQNSNQFQKCKTCFIIIELNIFLGQNN